MKGKSVGIDNTPAELVQAGEEAVAIAHKNLQQGLADRRIANLVDPVLGHHTSQGRQPAAVAKDFNIAFVQKMMNDTLVFLSEIFQ